MNNLEDLYSGVPPTKLRNIDEKFCPASTSRFWTMVANFFFTRMLEDRFYAFRYKGVENYIYAKLEYYNLTGSIKDRIVYYILDKAIKEAEIAYSLNPLPAYKQLKAQILFYQKKYKEAFETFNKSIS